MPRSDKKPGSLDAYGKFPIRVKWKGKAVAGMTKMGRLDPGSKLPGTGANKAGGIMRKPPGHRGFEPVILEKGMTLDLDFMQWAEKCRNPGPSAGMVSKGRYCRDLVIDVIGKDGRAAKGYLVRNAWVSKIQAPGLDAGANDVAIESIQIENEGWEDSDGGD